MGNLGWVELLFRGENTLAVSELRAFPVLDVLVSFKLSSNVCVHLKELYTGAC